MNVLIVEDEKLIAKGLKNELLKWDFDVDIAEDFSDITSTFLNKSYSLVFMDVNLPFKNGFHWCSEIRKISKVPIIFVSSRDSSMDLVQAITLGADDYITKPVDTTVLLAKTQALLRRSYDYVENMDVLKCNNIILNIGEAKLIYLDKEIPLSRTELLILKELFLSKGKFVERENIMEKCWQGDDFIDDNTLAVNIARIRKKLSEIGLINFIITRKNHGYAVNMEKGQ